VAGTRLVQLDEKPTLTQLVNAGIYVLDPELLTRVPRGCNYLITSLFEDCLRRGKPVETFEIEDEWIDVGQRDQLRLARGGDA
jgi:NDP-sugar pyrophosphorylase family protein